MTLPEGRPVQNRIPGRVISNRYEFGKVRLTCLGGYENGSHDRDAGNNSHKNQESNAVSSRDGRFLLSLQPATHLANISPQRSTSKEFRSNELVLVMSDPIQPISGSHHVGRSGSCDIWCCPLMTKTRSFTVHSGRSSDLSWAALRLSTQ